MSSIVQLKRSALSGKVPGTGSLNLGELALNTYDGKIFFRRSGSTDTIQEVVTTNSVVTGSIRLEGTGSFGSLKVNDTLTVNHGETIISGSALVTSDLTILGAVKVSPDASITLFSLKEATLELSLIRAGSSMVKSWRGIASMPSAGRQISPSAIIRKL